ncbi:hypothetical protein GF1_11890 [Desulfolithobacter dissulfuricans]|uniref:Replication initiation factor n=1 Tax=Desulfolithobacter dissulfuricans TaxID=2795293 RepID=A0A915TZJ7_9BACT|nr:hypothetical protein [Desulfolithobacter dissulfuricans]BCO08813.1 hypothetical protein GF1_11890 [Desulfolithobacter dissulfuricans]
MDKVKSFTGDVKGKLDALSQAGITWGGQLAKGLDRLKYGLHVEFSDETFFDVLGEGKNKAQQVHSPVPITFEGRQDHEYIIHSTGRRGGFAFHLSRADVHIFVSVREDYMSTPNIWVDIGSMSCWSPGYQAVIEHVNDLVFLFGGKIRKVGLSEVHLCVDCIGLEIEELGLHDYSRWITRANKFRSFADRVKFTGVGLDQSEGPLGISDSPYDQVGYASETGLSVGEGDIALRVYDKTHELRSHGAKQSVFASVWGQDQYNDVPVTRVEFQLRRPVLRQLGVSDLYNLQEKIGGIWEYCSDNWARFSAVAIDRKNRHQDRAVIHPWWQVIQSVDWLSYRPVVRKQPLPQKDQHQLIDMMVGCALNIAAIDRCKPTIDHITTHLQAVIDTWCRIKSHETDKRGQSVLIAKYNQKVLECWPHGFGEVHGPQSAYLIGGQS